MSKRTVRTRLNLAELPALTAKQKAALAQLAGQPDASIDYSDAPAMPPEFWEGAEQGRFYKPAKTSTTVRIDSDVLAWLKSQGQGYQTKINAILRREMLAASSKSSADSSA